MLKLTSLTVALILAVSAFADPLFSCGSHPTVDELRAIEKEIGISNIALPSRRSDGAADAATLNVIFHVVYANNTVAGGNIPDSLIQQQIQVFNQDYNKFGITWRLAGIDRTLNPNWANGLTEGSSQEQQMKTALRKGGPADLNVYGVASIGGAPPGYLLDGYATFPWDFQNLPWKDGIVLAWHVYPGGPYSARNLGRTLSHEAGHWLGLLHTFQGGCTAPGDYVDDTPFEQSPASGCPSGRDTCPQPGGDPIQNYMDYTDDSCRTGLTPGQFQRVRAAAQQFRGISI